MKGPTTARQIKPHEAHRECPACGRFVARWTNGGRIPPHGKRTVRHKCPHGKWCPQGDPLWGTHSNGRTHPNARGGCQECHDAWLAKEVAARQPKLPGIG